MKNEIEREKRNLLYFFTVESFIWEENKVHAEMFVYEKEFPSSNSICVVAIQKSFNLDFQLERIVMKIFTPFSFWIETTWLQHEPKRKENEVLRFGRISIRCKMELMKIPNKMQEKWNQEVLKEMEFTNFN